MVSLVISCNFCVSPWVSPKDRLDIVKPVLRGHPRETNVSLVKKTSTGYMISEQYVPLWGIYAGETEKPYGMQNTGMKTIAIVLDRLNCFKTV